MKSNFLVFWTLLRIGIHRLYCWKHTMIYRETGIQCECGFDIAYIKSGSQPVKEEK